jgi:hypothetical protein
VIRKRFPKIRTLRISAWTTIALAWAIAIVGRQMEAPAAEEAALVPEPTSTTSPAAEVANTMPTMPEDGLVVIRYTPAPPPPPSVVRQVVVQAAPSSPTVSASQGS